MKSKTILIELILILIILNSNIISAKNESISLHTNGGWSNYDLRGTGWATYYQIGIEKKNSNKLGYGLSLLTEKTNQERDHLIHSYHYIPEVFLSKEFNKKFLFSRISVSSGLEYSYQEYYSDRNVHYSNEQYDEIYSYENRKIGYSGSVSVSVGSKIGNFKIAPKFTLRLHPHGSSFNIGLLIYSNIF